MKKITEQEKREYLAKYGFELVSNVEGNIGQVKIIIKHIECGTIFPVRFNCFKKGQRCKKCSIDRRNDQKRTTENQMIEFFLRSGYILIEFVKGNIGKTKQTIQHFTCGFTYPVTFDSFKQGNRCPECFGNIKYTEEDIRKHCLKIGYELIMHINGNIGVVKQLVKHVKCGFIFPVCFSVLKEGYCPKCSRRAKINKEDILKFLSENAPDYELIKHVIGAIGKVKQIFRHTSCGYIFPMRFSNFKNAGNRCPDCKNFSSERLSRKIFESIIGHKFPKVRPKFLRGLELDGYCEELKLAFEYNGIQHNEVRRGLIPYDTEDELNKRQERDRRKIKLCERNNIKLCVIPYTYSFREPKLLEAFIKCWVFNLDIF
jgi:hypothetical protein